MRTQMTHSVSGVLKHTLAVAVALGLSGAAQAESLADAMASAYTTSGLLEQNRATLRAADEGVASAAASLKPTLSYSYTSQLTEANGTVAEQWTNTMAFVGSMTLFTFGGNKMSVNAAKETVLATRQSLVSIEQQVFSSVVASYQDVREAQSVVNLRQNALKVSSRNLRAAEDRFEVGEITRTSLAQVQSQVAAARAQLAAAQGQLASAREAYKVAVGNYPENLQAVPAVSLPVSDVDAAVEYALKNHPQIKALQHQVSASELAVRIAKAGLMPSVTATLNSSYSEGAAKTSANSATIGVSGTIYAGGAKASAIRGAVANRDAVRAQLLQTTRQIEQGVRANWALLAVNRASERASQAQVEAQRLAFDGVFQESRLGAATVLQALDAEQDLLDAQVGAIQSKIARESQSYAVLQSMGLMTVANLGLQVTVYDPEAYYNAVRRGPISGRISSEGEKLDRVLEALGRD